MEDGMYRISLVKKQMIFLALRNTSNSAGEKPIAELLRALKRSLKEPKRSRVGNTDSNDPTSISN